MAIKQNSITKITLQELNNTIFYNPKGEVAKHATSLLWGQGWDLTIIKDKERNDELIEQVKKALIKAKFENIVQRNENAMSKHGYQINTIDKNNGGDIIIGEADPNYRSMVAKVVVSDIAAWVWKKFAWDSIHYTMIEKWDRLKVERSLMVNDESVNVKGFNAKVPEAMRIKPVWNHNLGILPVYLFKNYEAYVESPNQLYELADDYWVKDIPKAINTTYITEIKEQLLDTTKIFGNFSTAQLKKMKESGVGYDEQLLAQMFLNVKSRGENGGKLVEIQQAQLTQILPLLEARKQSIKDYWAGCGYAYMTGDETLDTNASNMFAKGKDIETTKNKRNLRQRQYAEFIKRFMVAMNLIDANEMEDIDVVFSIKENIVQSQEQIQNGELALIDAGLQTKAQALARIKDMNEDTAKAQIAEATKERDADRQKEMETFGVIKGENNEDEDTPKSTEDPNEPRDPKELK